MKFRFLTMPIYETTILSRKKYGSEKNIKKPPQTILALKKYIDNEENKDESNARKKT